MTITHNRLEFRWFELVIKYSCTIGCLSTMFSGWFYINDIGHGLISDSRLFHVWAVLAEKVACPKVALHIGRIYCTPPGVSIIPSFCFMKALRGRSQDMYITARKELIYCTKNKKAKCLVQAIAGFFAGYLSHKWRQYMLSNAAKGMPKQQHISCMLWATSLTSVLENLFQSIHTKNGA